MNSPELQHDKFEELDLPKILAALQKAREAKAPSRLIVDVADTGGIISVMLETKRRFK